MVHDEIGSWNVTNDVMQKPGEFKQLKFLVDMSAIFDGLGIRSAWRNPENGSLFGGITRTYNPSTSVVDQQYFASKSSSWSSSSQVIEFNNNGYSTGFSGKDQYAAFERSVLNQ